MDYKQKLEKEGSKILHTYPHKIGGKPVYFVKNKNTEKRHSDESKLNKTRGEIEALGKAISKFKK